MERPGRRGRTYNPAIAAVQRLAAGAHAAVLKATGGRVGGRLVGSPVLVLSTMGRRSGRRRATPLLYLEDAGRYVVVASNGGAAPNPAWYHNLMARPETTVRVGGREIGVRAARAEGEERERLWARLVAMYPPYDDYREKTDRTIPVLTLTPVEDERERETS